MGHTLYTRYLYLDFASVEVSKFLNEFQYNSMDQLASEPPPDPELNLQLMELPNELPGYHG